jgi:hypothetical protein
MSTIAENSTATPTAGQIRALQIANPMLSDTLPVASYGYGNSLRFTYTFTDEPALCLVLGEYGEFVDLQMWDNEEMSYDGQHYDSDWASIDDGELGTLVFEALIRG